MIMCVHSDENHSSACTTIRVFKTLLVLVGMGMGMEGEGMGTRKLLPHISRDKYKIHAVVANTNHTSLQTVKKNENYYK